MLAFKVPEDAVQATWEVKTPVILPHYGPQKLQHQLLGKWAHMCNNDVTNHSLVGFDKMIC